MEDRKPVAEPTPAELLKKARALRLRTGVRAGKSNMLQAIGGITKMLGVNSTNSVE